MPVPAHVSGEIPIDMALYENGDDSQVDAGLRQTASIAQGDCSGAVRHRKSYEQWLDSNLPAFDVLPVTEETTISYAQLRVAHEHFDELPDLKRVGCQASFRRWRPKGESWISPHGYIAPLRAR